MKGSVRIGKIFGIPIQINYTWFIIVVLITVSFATGTFPSQYPHWTALHYWIAGIVASLLLFVSVLLHELSHSLVSMARGTPVEGITLFIFGGIASIAEEPKKPLDELLMAIAGPIASFVLGIGFGAIALLTPAGSTVAGVAKILALMNLWLALFNLIPGFPLDGGRVLRALIWWGSHNMRMATRLASAIGQGIAVLMIIGGLFVGVFLGDWSNGLWMAFIGWFLENAARQSYSQFVLREMLAGVTTRDLMTEICPTIREDMPLQALVEEQVLRAGKRCLLLTDGDRLQGMVTIHNIKQVPRDQWGTTTVSQIMTPFDKIKTVDANDSALNVLMQMDEADVNQIPVMENGRLVGIISRENVLRFIRAKAELEL